MIKTSLHRPQGFMALLSAFIITILLTTIGLSTSTATFLSRFEELDECQAIQAHLADLSCMSKVLSMYNQDPATLSVGTQLKITPQLKCIFDGFKEDVSSTTSPITFQLHSMSGIVSIPLQGTADFCNGSNPPRCLTSWHEFTSMPP